MRSSNWNPLVYSASLSLHNSTAAVNNTTFNALKQFLKNPSLSEKRIVTIPRDGVIVQTEVTREAAPLLACSRDHRGRILLVHI